MGLVVGMAVEVDYLIILNVVTLMKVVEEVQLMLELFMVNLGMIQQV